MVKMMMVMSVHLLDITRHTTVDVLIVGYQEISQ